MWLRIISPCGQNLSYCSSHQDANPNMLSHLWAVAGVDEGKRREGRSVEKGERVGKEGERRGNGKITGEEGKEREARAEERNNEP